MLACADPPLPDRRSRPHPNQTLKCPRCNSSDTKFCYYNNYSMTQPRYFCKNCKRYWTDGGTLRNVPVGGGLRKYKKSKPKNSSTSSSSSTELHSIHVTSTTNSDDRHKINESPFINEYCPSLRCSQETPYQHGVSGSESNKRAAPSENLGSVMPELCNHVKKGFAQCIAAGYEKLYDYVGRTTMEQTPPSIDLHDIFVCNQQPVTNLRVQGPDRQVYSGFLFDNISGHGAPGEDMQDNGVAGENYACDWVPRASEGLFEGLGDLFFLQPQVSEIAGGLGSSGGAFGGRSNQNWLRFDSSRDAA